MKQPSRGFRGFSLVEVTLALGVAGFCLMVIMGLLPLGLNTNQDSIEQTLAASVTSQVYSDLRLAPKGAGARSPRYQLLLPPPMSSSTTTTSTQILMLTADGGYADSTLQDSTIRFIVYVYLTAPPLPASLTGTGAGTPPGQGTMARVVVTWPPLPGLVSGTSSAPASGTSGILQPVASPGSFETIDNLDRG